MAHDDPQHKARPAPDLRRGGTVEAGKAEELPAGTEVLRRTKAEEPDDG